MYNNSLLIYIYKKKCEKEKGGGVFDILFN